MKKAILRIVACFLICLQGSSYARAPFMLTRLRHNPFFRHHLLSRTRYGFAQSLKVIHKCRPMGHWGRHFLNCICRNWHWCTKFNVPSFILSENRSKVSQNGTTEWAKNFTSTISSFSIQTGNVPEENSACTATIFWSNCPTPYSRPKVQVAIPIQKWKPCYK